MARLPSWVLTDFAEALLGSGKDRIPYKFDKRSVDLLRRSGLLVYPDGTYSLSDGAMDQATRTLSVVAKEPGGDPARQQELQRLVLLGQRWREPHPDVRGMKYGDLNYQQYEALWRLVVEWSRSEVFDIPTMTKRDRALWAGIERRGYVQIVEMGSVLKITPTAEGDRLVQDLGSPRPKTASYDFRDPS